MKRLTLGIVARPIGARLTSRVGLSLACGLIPTTALGGPVDVSTLRRWQRLALVAAVLLSLAAGYAFRTVSLDRSSTMTSGAAFFYYPFWAFLLLMLLWGVGEMWWRLRTKKDE